tara:strand:- start:1297 stop:1530 length:234 start_codon:yes stop_codon:yes gene_type:complete
MALFRDEEEKKFSIWLRVTAVFVVGLSAKLENPLRKVFATPTETAEPKKEISEDCGSLESMQQCERRDLPTASLSTD